MRNPSSLTSRNWAVATLIVLGAAVIGFLLIRVLSNNVSVRCERRSAGAGECVVTTLGPSGVAERVIPLNRIQRASAQLTSPTLVLHTTEGDVAVWYGSNWRNWIVTQRTAADGINAFLADSGARQFQIDLGEDLGNIIIGAVAIALGVVVAAIYLKDAQHARRRLRRR